MNSNSGRPSFASKIIFDALPVEDGEESEEEELVIDSAQPSDPEPEKLSKSAIKKAQRASRIERKLQQRAAAKALRAAQAPVPPVEPTVDAPVSSSIGEEHATSLASESSPPDPEVVRDFEGDLPQHVAIPHQSRASELKSENTPSQPNGHSHALPSDSAPQPVTGIKALNAAEPPTKEAVAPVAPPGPPSKRPREEFSHLPSVPSPTSKPSVPSADAEKVKKRQSFITRTLWTFIMIGGFIFLLLLGHAYMMMLVMLCQTVVYREVTALFTLGSAKPNTTGPHTKKAKDPWSKTLNWYFFAVTNYFLYGESIIYYFKHVVFADAQLVPFVTNHRIISFTLYTIGFMGFVMSLKKGYLKQQFGLFCWVHMSLMLIVVSSHFIVNNILEGLIWFWVPASLVICNDVFAYIWGITLGRTPLIALSPKKTVEGFVGAFFSTLLFSVAWGTWFMQFDYMICPVRSLGISAWDSISCTPNPVFVWREWEIWQPVATVLSTMLGRSITKIPYAPYQGHLLLMACFASLVAPFGGFFASGFKRAFNIKDFGHSIPGHGGMTDRMDCQFLMGVFTYVYYSSLIRQNLVTVGSVLQTIVSSLTVDEQVELLRDLQKYLESQGMAIF